MKAMVFEANGMDTLVTGSISTIECLGKGSRSVGQLAKWHYWD